MTIKINFMEEALNEARLAFKNDEVPVGAVIVKDKKIISRAFNENVRLKDPTAHAEVLVIKRACKKLNSHRLDGCDLYVTLEPCQMCASIISLSHINRLYYGAADSKFGGVENGVKIFNSSSCHHKPEIYSGFCESESKNLLKEFFQAKR